MENKKWPKETPALTVVFWGIILSRNGMDLLINENTHHILSLPVGINYKLPVKKEKLYSCCSKVQLFFDKEYVITSGKKTLNSKLLCLVSLTSYGGSCMIFYKFWILHDLSWSFTNSWSEWSHVLLGILDTSYLFLYKFLIQVVLSSLSCVSVSWRTAWH